VSRRILVVDDEPDICMMLEKVLRENAFTVNSYVDPILALERFNPGSYDLVILDIKMQELNGFELYREIRRLDKRVEICFLTAGEMYYGIYSDIFSSLPANCFIRKPVENKELLMRINEILIEQGEYYNGHNMLGI
jgi:two-component system catabolic regulation response regulator CreB/two-component system response regulator ChvI